MKTPRISPAAIRWLLLLACLCFLLACLSCGWLGYEVGKAHALLPALPALRGTNPLPVPSDRLARRSNRPLAFSRRLDFYRSLTRGRIRRAALIVATLLPLVAAAARLAF